MKIKALKYLQKDKEIYIFHADPNYIRKMVKISDITLGDNEFQRPYDEKRIKEIKKYILGKDKLYKKGKDIFAKGYIPNAIVINLSDKFNISGSKLNELSDIEFPEKNKLKGYKDTIEIIDGQHRLLAIDDETKSELDREGVKYEMCFVAFKNLSVDEKKEIFMVLNERQKTVDRNILLRHKMLLNLLLSEDETIYEIITNLNSHDDSPFKNHIIMAGEKIKYGLKAVQFEEILKSSKSLSKILLANGQLKPKGYQVLKNYFIAWKNIFSNIWFENNNTLTKIAGVRFMCYLFPFIYDILEHGSNFKVESYEKYVIMIRDENFNKDFDIKKANKSHYFQERSGIIKISIDIGKELLESNNIINSDIIV